MSETKNTFFEADHLERKPQLSVNIVSLASENLPFKKLADDFFDRDKRVFLNSGFPFLALMTKEGRSQPEAVRK
jgi:hypothetical protein